MENNFNDKEIACNYDKFYVSEYGKLVDEIEKKMCSDFLKDIPKSDMLEIGCGTGHWSEFFIDNGFQLVATDISEAMLDVMKSKNLNVDIKLANSENLPFKDNEFSIVSSITMIEFVENQKKVIDEIYRVLKPNGFLLMGCLNKNSVLWENRENNKHYKGAKFLTPEEFSSLLSPIGKAKISLGVYIDSNFEILDFKDKALAEPAFILALVKKEV